MAGCTSIETNEASLDGITWQVTAINGSPTAETQYRLQFDDDRISGRFGCNHLGGFYRVERNRLIVEDAISTLMGCPEPAATHEAQAFRILNQPMGLDWISGQRVTLRNPAGSITLERGD